MKIRLILLVCLLGMLLTAVLIAKSFTGRPFICDERDMFTTYPVNHSSQAHICGTLTETALLVPMQMGNMRPIPIRGRLAQNPIWSPDEHAFVFSVRFQWGTSVLFSYFLYDFSDTSVSLLHRSRDFYGLAWAANDGTVLFSKQDATKLCYNYYEAPDRNQLVEVKNPQVAVNTQCVKEICMKIISKTGNCQ